MKFLSDTPEATQAFGERLGGPLRPGDVIALIGELGTGKTCLTHGIARGAGLLPNQSVNSPSYVLINEYQARCPIYHIDLYRITKAEQLGDLGLDDYLYGNGICVIEWADRALEWLSEDHLRIYLEWVDEDRRTFILEPIGPRFRAIAEQLVDSD